MRCVKMLVQHRLIRLQGYKGVTQCVEMLANRRWKISGPTVVHKNVSNARERSVDDTVNDIKIDVGLVHIA